MNFSSDKKDNGKKENRNAKNHDGITMLFCVLAAICIWFYVMSVDSPTATEVFSSVPVTVITENDSGDGTELSVISGGDSVIEVTLKGRKKILNALSSDDIEVIVDVSATDTSGKGVYDVTVEPPDGTVIEDYYPKEVTVYMGKKSIVTIPVKCKLTGYTVSSEYTLDTSNYQMSIDTVQVSGPETELAKLDSARIVLTPGTITQSFSGTGPLELVDVSGNVVSSKYLTMSVSEATATFNVYTSKYLSVTVGYKYNYFADNGTTVTVSPARIRVKGLVEKLNQMTSLVATTIDETRITEDGLTRYDLTLPEGIEFYDTEYDSVSVNVRFEGTKTKSILYDADDILCTNIPDDKAVTILDPSLQVTIRGTEEKLRRLTKDDITVTLDLETADNVGEQFMTANVVLKDGNSASCYPVGTYSVQIQVSDK